MPSFRFPDEEERVFKEEEDGKIIDISVGSDLADKFMIAIVTENGKLYAINGQRGLKLWEFATGSEVNSSPAIGPDGTADNLGELRVTGDNESHHFRTPAKKLALLVTAEPYGLVRRPSALVCARLSLQRRQRRQDTSPESASSVSGGAWRRSQR